MLSAATDWWSFASNSDLHRAFRKFFDSFMDPTNDETLTLEFPDWSGHPPPPRLSNDDYADWIEYELQWLGPKDPASRPGPVTVWFEL